MFLLFHILQKVVLITNAVLRTKIEMLENNQNKIFSSVYYEMAAEASLQLRNKERLVAHAYPNPIRTFRNYVLQYLYLLQIGR